jgi:MFS family permease
LTSQVRAARAFIVLMGVVAMFGDMTYEGVRGLAGPYLGLLGASAAAVGFWAGLGEFLGYGLRLGSGWLSDRTRAYWPLVIAGYATNFLVVIGLALARTWQGAVAMLALERIGKAVRSPARSTLISYAAQQVGVGRSFGIEEALDQLGAVSGPLLAALAMWVVRGRAPAREYQIAFGVLMVPVVANLATVLFARRRYPRPESFEPTLPTLPTATARSASRGDLGGLFGWYLAGGSLLGLGFADWALVSFHAGRTGAMTVAHLPVLYAAAMAVDALAALGFGTLFDRFGVSVLAASAILSAGFAPLAFLRPGPWGLAAGAALWAIGLGAQDAVFKAAIAKLVPKAQRGRAYGVFFAVFGLFWWLGSAAMGWLYQRSLVTMVVFSVVTQIAAAPMFLLVGRELRRRRGVG